MYFSCQGNQHAFLHLQGVVHRDVKPGNFLFSCKANKGFLIDFNLAMVRTCIQLVFLKITFIFLMCYILNKTVLKFVFWFLCFSFAGLASEIW